jgi:hypothetical protein
MVLAEIKKSHQSRDDLRRDGSA